MTPRLRLLGRARVFDGQRWLEAPLDKRFCLLAYLACAEDWVERERLAFLFWPDVEEPRARRDLRYLVYRTKALDFASNLETQPGSLRWRAETDVRSLRQAAEQEEWATAVALYGGELLQGLNLEDSPEFMAWLELERKNLHDIWREAVLKRTAELENASQHLEAAALAKSLVAADELDEDALQAYLRNAFLGGRRNDALETYQCFTNKLQEELGLEPLPATQELLQALQSWAATQALSPRIPEKPASLPAKRLYNFPAESTSFIGRDLELTEIVNTLSQPSCRLLTLVGPGGIGKTRLAQKAAIEVADGVTFVPLAPVGAATLLASAIASALSFSFFGQEQPETQLLSYLRDKEMLLVLDNLEHLLEGVGLIKRILETCPKVKILATSRERLHLSSERLLQIGGMSLPEGEEATWLEGFDAVQLFLRRARRVWAEFTFDEENRAAVLRICQLVGGAPLGIELAAGWVTVLSCQEIAEEMEKDFDFLSSSLRDVPERHRSLRRVFEHSWRLLADEEQTAFKRLSVFRGGFTREAAEQVADVSMRALLSLHEKSLIKRSPSGRFDLHELVKQYAAEKLSETPEEAHAIHDRHGTYYARFLQEREQWAKGKRQQQALQEIEEELDNIRSAWRWAVKRRDSRALEQASSCLRYFYQIRGFFQEGEAAFRLAADNLAQESVTHGRLLIYQGLFNWWLGRGDAAKEVLERSLAILTRQQASSVVMANVHFTLGLAHQQRGVLEQAKHCFVKALEFARKGGDLWFESRALKNLGVIAENEGAFDEAEAYYRQAITLFRQADDRWGLAMGLGELGRLLEKLGHAEAARKHYLESLEAARAIGGRVRMAGALLNLANLSYGQRHYEQAEAYYTECLSIVKERNDETFLHLTERCLIGLGETARALRKYRESLEYFHEAIKTALSLNDVASATRSVVGIADLLLNLREEEKALALLVFSLEQPDIEEDTRERAERLYTSLTEQLSEPAIASAREWGRTMRFDEIAAMMADWQQRTAS